MNITRFIRLGSIVKHGKIVRVQYNGLKSYSLGGFPSMKHYEGNKKEVRFTSTYEVKTAQKEDSWFVRQLKKIYNIENLRIGVAGYLLYESIADKVNYIDFFEEFDLQDTFYSWFVVTELYIWMLSVRAMAEGDNGKSLRNYMLEALWADVAQRAKQLGGGSISRLKDNIIELSEQLQAAFIAYDEGLQSSDTVLAGALWRRLYQSELANPEHLEQLVKYVRKQIVLLENVSWHHLYKKKYVEWEPFKRSISVKS